MSARADADAGEERALLRAPEVERFLSQAFAPPPSRILYRPWGRARGVRARDGALDLHQAPGCLRPMPSDETLHRPVTRERAPWMRDAPELSGQRAARRDDDPGRAAGFTRSPGSHAAGGDAVPRHVQRSPWLEQRVRRGRGAASLPGASSRPGEALRQASGRLARPDTERGHLPPQVARPVTARGEAALEAPRPATSSGRSAPRLERPDTARPHMLSAFARGQTPAALDARGQTPAALDAREQTPFTLGVGEAAPAALDARGPTPAFGTRDGARDLEAYLVSELPIEESVLSPATIPLLAAHRVEDGGAWASIDAPDPETRHLLAAHRLDDDEALDVIARVIEAPEDAFGPQTIPLLAAHRGGPVAEAAGAPGGLPATETIPLLAAHRGERDAPGVAPRREAGLPLRETVQMLAAHRGDHDDDGAGAARDGATPSLRETAQRLAAHRGGSDEGATGEAPVPDARPSMRRPGTIPLLAAHRGDADDLDRLSDEAIDLDQPSDEAIDLDPLSDEAIDLAWLEDEAPGEESFAHRAITRVIHRPYVDGPRRVVRSS